MIAVDGKTLRGSATGRRPCSRRWTTPTVWCWARLMGTPRPTRSPCSPRCWTARHRRAVITADALHAQRGHATYLAGRGAHYLLRSSATSPACLPSSPPCPGGRCRLPATLASAATAGPSGHPEGHRRRPRAGLPPRRPGHPDRAPPTAQRQEVVCRNLLRGHVADRHPGQRHPARRHHPRPLDHRGPPPNGSATWTSTRTAPRFAPPAAPTSWRPCATSPSRSAPGRRHQHRRRPALPRPAAQPPLQAIMNC